MLPIINIFGFELSASNFMWGIGILCSTLFYFIYGLKIIKIPLYKIILLSVYILLVEILGAKTLYIIENFEYVLQNGLTFAGFSLLGVFFFIPPFIILFTKIFKLDFLKTLDFLIIGMFIELAFYRIGCMLEGCCHGFIYEHGILGYEGLRYFPIQPIEAGLDFIIAILLLIPFKTKWIQNGDRYLIGVLSYCLIRFVLEFFRVRNNIILNMSSSHIICLILFLIHALILFMRKYKLVHTYEKN